MNENDKDEKVRKDAIELVALDLLHWRRIIEERHIAMGIQMQAFCEALEINNTEQRRISEVVDANTRDTTDIKRDTGEMLEMFKSWQGAMKVFGWFSRPLVAIASFVSVIVGIIAAYAALWPKK